MKGTAMTTSSIASSRSRDADALDSLDHRYLLHPHQTTTRPGRRIIVRGKGCNVWDTEGHEYLDAMGGGVWLGQVGHGRRELAEAAAAQTEKLEYFSCWREYSNEKAVELAAKLASLSPGDLNKIFFSNGGSEGTDTAIKIARRYFHNIGQPDRTWIIGRQLGYHGCTLGSGSVTGFDDMQYGVGPVLPHIEKVTPPMPYHQEFYNGQDVTDFLINELEQTINRIGAGQIAAMIGEPILGGGGVVAPPPDYWPRVRRLLSEHGILLIADEVITGYGRIGTWFASEPMGMDADIIITAKALSSGYAPLGAVLMRDGIGEAIANGESHFFHGGTYYGHPVACAVALANLGLIEDEGLRANAVSIGEWFREGLAPARELPAVGDVRVEGAMIGVELVADKTTRESMPAPAVLSVVDELQNAHGVLLRDYGPTLVMGPSFIFTQEQAARACHAVVEVLSRLDAHGNLSSGRTKTG
jgi:PLP-dependent transaminase